ncbi:MAG TPA: SirB2 family protein [Cellvibrio sp.]|nr:SirB2 family protein [Cellvibrio sp.]
MYAILKHSHLLIIVIAFVAFFARGILMMRGSPAANAKAFKIVPHILYTLLIATGVGLALTLHFSPMQQPWLMAKIIALVLYVVLGVLTFKHPKLAVRKLFWLLSLTVFAYMASVATSKNPLGFFAHLL